MDPEKMSNGVVNGVNLNQLHQQIEIFFGGKNTQHTENYGTGNAGQRCYGQ
jgi:hypothetical protein